MRIRGRVVCRGEPVADAKARIWLVKRSDGAEILVFDGRSSDNGTFGVSLDVIDGLSCNSQHFSHVRYSIEKNGFKPKPAHDIRPIDNEDIRLGDIALIREAIRISGRVISNGRPVRAAKVVVCIDGVERACIPTGNNGAFERMIEGDYEGRKLEWSAKRFGYIGETGTRDICSNEIDLEGIDLVPHWWTGMCQNLGVDSQVVPGVILSLVLGALLVYWLVIRCPDASVKPQQFTKNGATMETIQPSFNECRFGSQEMCGAQRDDEIIRCMVNGGYQYTK